MMDRTGQQFGSYRIEASLGTGRIAEVYRALDLTLGQAVALKLLHSELSADPGFVARFAQAAPRLATLNRPQIVPVTGWCQHEGRAYLAMPLMNAGSLRRLLDPQTGLAAQPPRFALDLALQVAEGLAYAHAQ